MELRKTLKHSFSNGAVTEFFNSNLMAGSRYPRILEPQGNWFFFEQLRKGAFRIEFTFPFQTSNVLDMPIEQPFLTCRSVLDVLSFEYKDQYFHVKARREDNHGFEISVEWAIWDAVNNPATFIVKPLSIGSESFPHVPNENEKWLIDSIRARIHPEPLPTE